MVGLVLVSHSRSLAEATLSLVQSMTGQEVRIAIAAGTGDDHKELGTDAMEILQAVISVDSEDGVLVMMDMGSAILSAETALDFMEEATKVRTHLCGAPFVEGTVAAAVAAKIGRPLKGVEAEAYAALKQKTEHLGQESEQGNNNVSPSTDNNDNFENAPSVTVDIKIPHGLHARPVANLIQEASKYKSDIQIKNLTNGKGPASIKSMTGVISLEVLYGNKILLQAKGEDAQQALDDLKNAIESGLGDKLEVDTPQPEEKESKETQNTNDTQKPIGVSEGIAIGKVFYPPASSFEVPQDSIEDTEKEEERLNTAINEAVDDLKKKIALPSSLINNEQRGIYNAHIAIINDPELKKKAEAIIQNDRKNAAFA
ncbi:MAG: HPr family phosphocarrier protein [Odoribacter sp.]|nr:HPr family phosphocarrier protein [Odoribacter sp.]